MPFSNWQLPTKVEVIIYNWFHKIEDVVLIRGKILYIDH